MYACACLCVSLRTLRRTLCDLAGGASMVLDQAALGIHSRSAVLVQVRSVKRGGKLPGMRSSETRITPSGSATLPTERIY